MSNEIEPGEIVTVYAVVVNSDGTEGRGRDYDKAYFYNKNDAITFSKGKDVMGSDGKVQNRLVVCVSHGRFSLFHEVEVKDRVPTERDKALVKLKNAMSEKELEILGINLEDGG
jgi:hypothetical protein